MKIPVNGVSFFDSGIGGLTVMHACRARLPNEIFYYYGDNDHAPYGNLPTETLRSYVAEAFALFQNLQVKAVVLACNTVTACCVEDLRREYSFPIIGAEPAVLSAGKEGGKILALATVATCKSARFQKLCQNANEKYPNAEIIPMPCPCLAGEIEEKITRLQTSEFALPLPPERPDGVVLGCTHYIYIKKKIQAFYGCKTYDGNQAIAKRLETVLKSETSPCRDWQPPSDNSTKNDRDRERRPLLSQPIFLEKNERNPNEQKMNKNSFFTENSLKIAGENTYFIGKSRKINQKIYEQMFVL